MKNKTYYTLALGLFSGPLIAGEVESSAPLEPIKETATSPKLFKIGIDGRIRYESRGQQGLDFSNALTVRLRPSLTLFPEGPVTFFVESEHTEHLIGDFNSSPSTATSPSVSGNTGIFDPNNHEINRAWAQFKIQNLTAKVGRQRIIFDNAAHIGNVGWRQNEQTFDAARLTYKKGNFDLTYAFASRVNRIFGRDPGEPLEAFEGDFHLINGHYTADKFKVGGYAYLLDFDVADALSTNTYGTSLDYKITDGNIHAEFAYQTESGDQPSSSGTYFAGRIDKKVGGFGLWAGFERLDEDFITPLATVHAFNGFADTFIGNRIGLADWDGITDFYVGASKKFGSYLVKTKAHYFADADLSNTYGWEVDAVVVKPITKNVKALAKFAYYFGDDGGDFANDVSQASVQLDFSF